MRVRAIQRRHGELGSLWLRSVMENGGTGERENGRKGEESDYRLSMGIG